jgi:signal transduction histidine kinase
MASVFLLVGAVFMYMEYSKLLESDTNAGRLMETGPGYINGVTPGVFDGPGSINIVNLYDALNQELGGLTPSKVIENFRPIVDSTLPGGVGFSTTVTRVPEAEIPSYKAYLVSISKSEIGPVLLTDNYFSRTIHDYLNQHPIPRLFYLPIEGYDDIVFVASLDPRFMPQTQWLDAVVRDIIWSLPLVTIFALFLGWAISRMTVNPVTRLTQFSERLAEGALDERTVVKSQDEIGRLAHSLNRMAAGLQQAFDSQKRFVSDAAHEMKTPLASMKTAVTGAMTEKRTTEEYQQLLEVLSRRIEAQERLITDLLFQARADETTRTTDYQTVDLTKIVTGVAEEFAPLFDEKGIKLRLETSQSSGSKPVTVKGDGEQFSRVFSNLLDNAAKYTSPGGEAVLELTTEGDNAVIKVKDSGKGIAPEHLDKIFDRFFKVSEERTPESGYGLGLSISHAIITRHGGEITVESTLGKGSLFAIKLTLFREGSR